MRSRFWIKCLIPVMFFAVDAHAQTDTLSPGYWDHVANLHGGLSYLSDNVFLGRKDTIVTPYLGIHVGYTLKNGLYVSAEADYTTAHSGRLDAGAIGAGYNFKQGLHWGGSLFAEKYFYNKSSRSIRAEISAVAGAEVNYENDILSPALGFMLAIGKKTDVILNPSLSHELDFLNGHLSITPMLSVFIATQHYLDAYFQHVSKISGKSTADNVVTNSSQFQVRDYEISMPVAYVWKRWDFSLQPMFVIPVNAASISGPHITFSEKLSNQFLFEAAIMYHLPSGKSHR